LWVLPERMRGPGWAWQRSVVKIAVRMVEIAVGGFIGCPSFVLSTRY